VDAEESDNRQSGKRLLAVLGLLTLLAMLMYPRIPQTQGFHDFADKRPWPCGALCAQLPDHQIPHAANVLSNLPFLVTGLYGFRQLARVKPTWRLPWWVLFGSVTATCFGSGYYHWAPKDFPLIFDRLFIALGLMALLSIVIHERVDRKLARWLCFPLLALGAVSSAIWLPLDDVRLYYFVQGGSLLTIAIVSWHRRRYGPSGVMAQSKRDPIWGALGLYLVAKVCEGLDKPIYAVLGEALSGHTLKHFFAAGGTLVLAFMIPAPDRATFGESRTSG
jgi:hypothetical protein